MVRTVQFKKLASIEVIEASRVGIVVATCETLDILLYARWSRNVTIESQYHKFITMCMVAKVDIDTHSYYSGSLLNKDYLVPLYNISNGATITVVTLVHRIYSCYFTSPQKSYVKTIFLKFIQEFILGASKQMFSGYRPKILSRCQQQCYLLGSTLVRNHIDDHISTQKK